MRGRPDVDIKMPAVVHPGDDVAVKLLVTSRADTPIDFIEVVFRGEEVVSSPGEGQRRRAHTIVEKTFRLRERDTLAEGAHELAVDLSVPHDAPGSYVGVCATIAYEVHLHVSIPWWPDLRETYELVVEPHGSSRRAPVPATQSSARSGGPFIELSLADTSFAAGDEIAGAFAIGNVPHGGKREVEISLIGLERARLEGRPHLSVLASHIAPGMLIGRRDGGEVPFRFRVPAGVVPSFTSQLCDLSWAVEAQLRSSEGAGPACRVPVEVSRYVAVQHGSRTRPRIGADRWRRVWSEVGEQHGLALHEDRLALAGSRGEVTIEVERDETMSIPALVATLRYPSLELGLRLARHRLVVLPNELELLFPGHKVHCRELPQGRAFFTGPLCKALHDFDAIQMEDRRAAVSGRGPGVDPESLWPFLDRIAVLADALTDAMASIPPPAAMRGALPAWQAFAEATGARLSPGSMTLMAASVDGAVFRIATLLDERGRVTGTRISLEIDPPLDSEIDPDDPDAFAAVPPGCRDLALALQSSVRALVIAPHALTVTLDGAAADPADLRPRMTEALALAKRLRGDRAPGPYR